jgi:hypothetical protein
LRCLQVNCKSHVCEGFSDFWRDFLFFGGIFNLRYLLLIVLISQFIISDTATQPVICRLYVVATVDRCRRRDRFRLLCSL